jgi:hypothetical protein
MTAVEIHDQLEELETERALVLLGRLPIDGDHLTELVGEIAATRSAYVGTAVTEIASLRAELSGPCQG